MTATAAHIDSRTVADKIASALRLSYSGAASAVKQLARDASINDHTARNIYECRNAMRADTLIKLIAQDDHVYQAVLDLSGRTSPAHIDAKSINQAIQILQQGINSHDGERA